MKKNNPHTPIMLRDAAGTAPRVYARYGMSTVYYAPNRSLDYLGTALLRGVERNGGLHAS
jgi:hypothetical protein